MSRHRFDHSVDRSDDTKKVSAPARLRRIEMITGVERRRKWSVREKAEIVAESLDVLEPTPLGNIDQFVLAPLALQVRLHLLRRRLADVDDSLALQHNSWKGERHS
jgi:hypothetical protein